MARLGGLELGGTNAIVVVGDEAGIQQRISLPVTDPVTTLALIGRQIDHLNDVQEIDAFGIASFGPMGIRRDRPGYGCLGQTPKPGWANVDLIGRMQPLVAVPVAISTDVIAAAMAEGRWGAAQGCADYVYITVGTGIGIGIVANGRPVVGQLHPEGGHIRVRRKADDSFPGICRFHGDCVEGLASGPAIAARAGRSGPEVDDKDPVWEFVADALAEMCATLFLTLSSERIIFGGGVINSRPWLVDEIGWRCAEKLAHYLPSMADRVPILPAGLGNNAGPRGSLILAELALSESRDLPLG